MIPADWIAHERADDGERLGYLVPEGERYVPVTLFGYPLGPAGDQDDARLRLDEVGLGYLANRWRLDVAGRADPIDVEIVEVDPDGLVVKNVDFGDERDYGTRIRLDVPVTGGLRPA